MRSDQQWPNDRAAVAGNHANLNVRIGEAGLFGDHRDVAEKRERRAQSNRVAVYRADDRLLHDEHILDDTPAVGGSDRTAVEAVAAGASAD